MNRYGKPKREYCVSVAEKMVREREQFCETRRLLEEEIREK